MPERNIYNESEQLDSLNHFTIYPMILVSSHRHESSFRENKGFEIFREISIFFLWSIRDMQPRLISVHWVENDLDKQKNQ